MLLNSIVAPSMCRPLNPGVTVDGRLEDAGESQRTFVALRITPVEPIMQRGSVSPLGISSVKLPSISMPMRTLPNSISRVFFPVSG